MELPTEIVLRYCDHNAGNHILNKFALKFSFKSYLHMHEVTFVILCQELIAIFLDGMLLKV